MKVVVLGANGFIGHHVCLDLATAGHAVTRIGRREQNPGDTTVDLFDEATPLSDIFEGADACIHLACDIVPSSAEAAGWHGFERNVKLAGRVADACSHAGIGILVFASSGGTVYGNVLCGAHEGQACVPIGMYGAQKVAAEALLRARLSGSKTRLVLLRLSNPFGPGQEARRVHGVIGRIFYSILTGEPFTIWGDGSQVRDYVPVSDVARAFTLALDRSTKSDVFNIGSGVGLNMIELIELCSKISGVPLRYSFRPKSSYEVDRIFLDIGSASRDLGWSPEISLNDGLSNYFNYLKESL